MTLRKNTIIGFVVYFSLLSTIVSPSLTKFFSIPRLDSALMPAYTFIALCALVFYGLDRKMKYTTIALLGISLAAFFSLILSFSYERLIDVLYVSFLFSIFYFSSIYIKNSNYSTDKIRMILAVFLNTIYLGFFTEILFGIQLVSGDEQLSILDNAFKGFFYNTNDQAVVVTSLTSGICFFYILNQDGWKVRFLGYILLVLSGLIIFVSASRAALLGYIVLVLVTLFLNSNKIIKFAYIVLGFLISIFIFNVNMLIPIFNFLSKYSWLERSVERFELAIFSLETDNSVDYRAEIYLKFIENFKIVWIGYGPRNYFEYFAKNQLSYNLGYTNPHSFFIEIYLAFGIFAFLWFIAFLLISNYEVFNKSNFVKSQKIFYLLAVILFCWLAWVPSSLFRLPLVWFSVFIIFIYSKNNHLVYGDKDA